MQGRQSTSQLDGGRFEGPLDHVGERCLVQPPGLGSLSLFSFDAANWAAFSFFLWVGPPVCFFGGGGGLGPQAHSYYSQSIFFHSSMRYIHDASIAGHRREPTQRTPYRGTLVVRVPVAVGLEVCVQCHERVRQFRDARQMHPSRNDARPEARTSPHEQQPFTLILIIIAVFANADHAPGQGKLIIRCTQWAVFKWRCLLVF